MSYIREMSKFRFAVGVAVLSCAGIANAEHVYTGTYVNGYLGQTTFPAGLSEEKVFLDADEAATITGHIGSQIDSRLVQFSSTTDILDAANGFGTIKADDGFINNITITAPGYFFEDLIFSVNFGPSANDDLTVTAMDSGGASDVFSNWSALDDWSNGENRILVLSQTGLLMQSVTINSVDGIGSVGGYDQLKQVEISGVTPIPEPEVYGMLIAGLGLIGFATRRKLS